MLEIDNLDHLMFDFFFRNIVLVVYVGGDKSSFICRGEGKFEYTRVVVYVI